MNLAIYLNNLILLGGGYRVVSVKVTNTCIKQVNNQRIKEKKKKSRDVGSPSTMNSPLSSNIKGNSVCTLTLCYNEIPIDIYSIQMKA